MMGPLTLRGFLCCASSISVTHLMMLLTIVYAFVVDAHSKHGPYPNDQPTALPRV